MISFLLGTVLDDAATVLTPGGVGYQVVALHALPVGEEIAVHVTTVMREEGWTLYGFTDRIERDTFAYLLSLSGIGPAAGMAALRSLGTGEVLRAVAAADVATLATVRGIGPKTAAKALASATALPQQLLALAGAADAADPDSLVARASSAVPTARAALPTDVAELAATLVDLGHPADLAAAVAADVVRDLPAGDDGSIDDVARVRAAITRLRAAA